MIKSKTRSIYYFWAEREPREGKIVIRSSSGLLTKNISNLIWYEIYLIHQARENPLPLVIIKFKLPIEYSDYTKVRNLFNNRWFDENITKEDLQTFIIGSLAESSGDDVISRIWKL